MMDPLASTAELLVDQQNMPIIYRMTESGGLYHALLATGDSQTPVLIPAEALEQLLQESKQEDEAPFLLEKQPIEQEVATTYIEIQKIESTQVDEELTPSKKTKKKLSPVKKKKPDSSKKKTPSKRKSTPPVELPPGSILTAKSLLGDEKMLEDYSVLGQSLGVMEPTLSELNSVDAELKDEKLKHFALNKPAKSEANDLNKVTPITVLAEGGIANLAALQAGIIPLPLSLLQQAAASQGVSLKTGSHSLHLKLSPSDVASHPALLMAAPSELSIPTELPQDVSTTPVHTQLIQSPATPVSSPSKKVSKTPAMRSLLAKKQAMRPILPKGGIEALQKLIQTKDQQPISDVAMETPISDVAMETHSSELNLQEIPPEVMMEYATPVKDAPEMDASFVAFKENVDVIEKQMTTESEGDEAVVKQTSQEEFQEDEAEIHAVSGEVFAKMSVTLSEEMLRAIPKSRVPFLNQLAKENHSQLRAVPDKNLFTILCNRFSDFSRIHSSLEKLMKPKSAEMADSEVTPNEVSEPAEKVVKKRGRPRGRPRKSEQKVTSEPDKVNLDDLEEETPKFSRSGRRLKLTKVKLEDATHEEVEDEPSGRRMRKQRKVDEEVKRVEEIEEEEEEEEAGRFSEKENEKELKYDVEMPEDNDVQLGHKYVKKRDYEAQCGYKFFCKICSFKSKRQSHYDNHIRLHQNSHSLFKCSKCSFTALRLNHLRRHEQTHIAQKVLQCAKCPYKSLKQELMARHCQKRHQMQAKTSEAIYKCRSCDYKTNRQHLIVRHLRVHSITDATNDCVEKIVKSYQCPKCDYATSRKENYLRHMNNIHLPVRPYLCDTCGKSFKRQDSLRTHAAVHLDRTKRQFPFKCYVCQKGLRSKAHLKEHLTTHSSQRAYLCEICGAAFKTRSVQRKHVQSIHQNPQSFYCMECPKTFNTKYSLLRHSKTHKNANQQLLLTDERNEIILPQLAADEMHQIQIEYPTGEIVTQPIVQVPPGLLQSTDDLSEEDKNGVLTTASLEGSAVMGSAEGFDQSIVQHMEARTLLSADTSSSALFYLN